jgi:hypothetical protein
MIKAAGGYSTTVGARWNITNSLVKVGNGDRNGRVDGTPPPVHAFAHDAYDAHDFSEFDSARNLCGRIAAMPNKRAGIAAVI